MKNSSVAPRDSVSHMITDIFPRVFQWVKEVTFLYVFFIYFFHYVEFLYLSFLPFFHVLLCYKGPLSPLCIKMILSEVFRYPHYGKVFG